MLDIESAARSIIQQIHARGKPEGIPKLQAYLGSPYPVLGLSAPQVREIVMGFWSKNPRLTTKELNTLASDLWSGPTHEEKSVAITLLNQYRSILNDQSWFLTDRWVEDCVGWGLCDSLGSGPISTMLYQKQSRFRDVVKWTASQNFWRRRIAAYAMHDHVLAGELDRPFLLLERMLYDEEFWVQRAVGTWLRECWRRDRRRTEKFLIDHARGLPKVVVTVSTERATKSFREKLRRLRSRPRRDPM